MPGGVILLRDADKDGRAEANTDVARGFGSSEVAVFDNHLYTENGTNVFYDADGPAKLFSGRCRKYQEEPPPDGWDGVEVRISK